jgi:DNA primase
VVHGGKNPTSLTYRADTGSFHCWGECSFKGDVFSLVSATEGCSFKDSVKRVEEFSTVGECTVVSKPRHTVDPLVKAFEDTYSDEEKPEVLSSPLVERALKNTRNPYVEQGRFRGSTMRWFEVGYCDFNEYFMDRAIITIHDEHGNLIGFSGRDMANHESTNKYRIKKGFKKGLCLYNLNRARHFVDSKNPLIICEGFGQVWRLYEAGYSNAVALMGKEITDGQYALISKYATKIILALDFDEPGREASLKLGADLSRIYDVSVVLSDMGPDTDLGDMTPEQAKTCIESAIPFKKWTTLLGGLT